MNHIVVVSFAFFSSLSCYGHDAFITYLDPLENVLAIGRVNQITFTWDLPHNESIAGVKGCIQTEVELPLPEFCPVICNPCETPFTLDSNPDEENKYVFWAYDSN